MGDGEPESYPLLDASEVRRRYELLGDIEKRIIELLCVRGYSNDQAAEAVQKPGSSFYYYLRKIHTAFDLDYFERGARAARLGYYWGIIHAAPQAAAHQPESAGESEPESPDSTVVPGPEPAGHELERSPRLGSVPLAVAAALTLLVVGAAAVAMWRKPEAISKPSAAPTACGELSRIAAPAVERLLRPQGVSSFTTANTNAAVRSDRVRSVAIGPTGLWLGYQATNQTPGGIGHYDRSTWAACLPEGHPLGMATVNDLLVDARGWLWAATEESGVAAFDGHAWRHFTTADGLPSNRTFALATDDRRHVWVGTWEGVARWDGQRWTVPYTAENRTLANNHVHAILFDAEDIWVGHVANGISRYISAERRWVSYTQLKDGLPGDHVRALLRQPSSFGDAIWVATADGGVGRLANGTWQVWTTVDGLPGNDVRDLGLDSVGRVWAATDGGSAHFHEEKWAIYTTLDTLSLAIGASCDACPYDADHVWTGTAGSGATHSRIPRAVPAIDVLRVYAPAVVAPGERFTPEVTVMPQPGFDLDERRGDFLGHVDDEDAQRFGAWKLVPVKGTVTAGQPYTFVDRDNPFVAPQLQPDEDERTFTSTWRVWAFTRYVGRPIVITFTVRRQQTVESGT